MYLELLNSWAKGKNLIAKDFKKWYSSRGLKCYLSFSNGVFFKQELSVSQ